MGGDRALTSEGAIGSIPFSAKFAYAQAHGICGDDFAFFIRVIETADRAFLAAIHKVREMQMKKDSGGRGGR